MLTKFYDNVSSNNEVIVKTSSVFLKFSKHFLNKSSPPQFLFDANHFHIKATLDTMNFDNLSKHFS